MGTRNLTMVIANGKTKVAQYGQWDGYPSGQGATALNFLKSANLNEFKGKVSECRFITEEEAKRAEKLKNGIFKQKYPALNRNHGADILSLINTMPNLILQDSSDFAADSLFCEWAYVIDLDNHNLEVYKGFNTSPCPEGERFAHLQTKEREDKYYPIRHVKTYSLDKLPTLEEFISECDPAEVEEEN